MKIDNLKYFNDYKKQIKQNIGDIKVVYTDMDGTILNNKGCLIMDGEDNYFMGALEQLKKLSSKNIDVVLVSGRNKMQLKYNAQMMNLKNYITEIGSELVYDLGREVHLTYDKSKLKYDFASLGPDLDKLADMLKKAFPMQIEYKAEWNRYRSTNILLLGEVDLEKANRLLEENGYGEHVLINNGLTSLYPTTLNLKKMYFYNLVPKGVDKSSGVRLDKKIRHFSSENCIALGDSLEDLKIAKEVSYFFLMNNNFHEEEDILKALPEYENVFISEKSMNKGWAEVIGYLF
ncbi:MAG: HAD family hydrolase [Candidatus Humimicrobiaceae bacterium]